MSQQKGNPEDAADQYRDFTSQARCGTCGVLLDGVATHADGCTYPAAQAMQARAMTAEEIYALRVANMRNTLNPTN